MEILRTTINKQMEIQLDHEAGIPKEFAIANRAVGAVPYSEDEDILRKVDISRGLTARQVDLSNLIFALFSNYQQEAFSFPKSIILQYLGIEKYKNEELNKDLNMIGLPLQIITEDKIIVENRRIYLFAEITLRKNKEIDAQTKVHIQVRKEAWEHLTNLKKEYTILPTQDIKQLDGSYEKKLFQLLCQHKNKYNGNYIIEIDVLKQQLGASSKLYEQFKYFFKDLIKPALQSINKNDNGLYVDIAKIEKIKEGRRIRKLKFPIQKV